LGVIDTFTAGFDRVTRRLWLVLLPGLVDVALWLAPQVSIRKVTEQAIAALNAQAALLGSQYEQSAELIREWMTVAGSEADLLSVVSMRAVGLPSLSVSLGTALSSIGRGRTLVEMANWTQLVLVVIGLSLLGLALGCFCLAWFAQEAREEPLYLGYILALTLRSAFRLSLLLVLGVLVLVSIGLGVGLGYGLMAVVSPQLAALFLTVLMIGGLWLSVYAGVVFHFVPCAMVFDDMGILHSVWSSARLVHRNVLSAVSFVLLASIIQAGLTYVWRLLAGSGAGTVVGILGNAYVSTGLVMASFYFYRDRFVAWQGSREGTSGGGDAK